MINKRLGNVTSEAEVGLTEKCTALTVLWRPILSQRRFSKKKFSSHNSHLTQAEAKDIGRIWSRNIVPDNAAKPESSLSLLRMYEIRVVG
jgi:hypothetical protein